jgi:uncharacterized protein YbaP (TraB family)
MIYWLLLAAVSLVACKTQQNIADQEGSVSVQNASEESVLENALLWKIEGNDLEQPSYLYGTIHLITEEDFYWPSGTLAAFDASDKVAFEIDMDDMFDMSKQMSMMSRAFMNDGKILKDFYSSEDYGIVKAHFEEMGIPLFFLERLKPMFLTVFASGDVEFGGDLSGGSGMRSYEMELFDLCQESNKEVSGLETIEFQMSVFDSIPYQVQADMLLETIKSADVEDDSFKMMVDMYRNQDINKMVSSMAEDESIKAYESILLDNRNSNWIPVMSDMMKQNSVFFAVGAGHLGGEKGVINLLKKAGYTLTPLSNS